MSAAESTGRRRMPRCPSCDGPMCKGSNICRPCYVSGRKLGALANRDPERFRCPDCDGPKAAHSIRCQACDIVQRKATNRGGGSQLGVYMDTAVHSVGRRESIITFGRGEETRSLQCFGAGKDAQIADGLARLGGDDWLVLSRSTPTTILADLHRDLSRSTAWEYAV